MFVELLLSFCLILIFSIFNQKIKRSNQPPGPYPLPLLGNLLHIAVADPTAYLAFDKLSRKYGEVMSLKLGLQDAIILSSLEAVKDVFSLEEMLGRKCDGLFWDRNLKKNIGLALSNGDQWVEIRKFCRDSLRNYGFLNREATENMIKDELIEFIKHLDEERMQNSKSCVIFTANYFQLSISNIIGGMLLGKRFDYKDEQFRQLLKHNHDFVKNGIMGAGLITAYPFLRYIFPEFLSYNIQINAMYGIYECAMTELNRKRKEDYHHNPRCFTDDFLNKIDEDANKPNPLFTEDNFKVVFADLWQAGTDTTSSALLFAVLLLATHSDIQDKLYDEITHVCGVDITPYLEQRQKMTYTQAVILEVLRWSRVVVTGVPKKALNDFQYRGYLIKKDSIVMANFHSIFFNEKFWGDPNIFRPERFLNQEGNLMSDKTEMIIPFGLGKRNCFGEFLARDSMFLYITTLFQKYKFQLPPGVKPSLEPVVGLTSNAQEFKALVTLRNPE